MAKWTFCLSLCASRTASLLLVTFSTCHAGIVSSFCHSLSTAAFASRMFIIRGIGINLCTKLSWLIELYLLLAMWSSWPSSRDDSKRFLVDLWASTVHACLVLESCWIRHSSHQFSGSWRAYVFLFYKALPPPLELPTFSHVWSVFVIIIFRIDEISASQPSSIIDLWLLVCPLFLFFLVIGLPILVHISGHTFSSRVVAWICVSLSLDHTYPWGCSSFNNVNFVKPFHESDKFLFKSIFQ